MNVINNGTLLALFLGTSQPVGSFAVFETFFRRFCLVVRVRTFVNMFSRFVSFLPLLS